MELVGSVFSILLLVYFTHQLHRLFTCCFRFDKRVEVVLIFTLGNGKLGRWGMEVGIFVEKGTVYMEETIARTDAKRVN